jgi:hypothetical protein
MAAIIDVALGRPSSIYNLLFDEWNSCSSPTGKKS